MKVCAICNTILFSMYSIIYAYLVYLSVITRIESYLNPVIRSFNSGSFTIKSSAIDFYGLRGVVSDFISLYRAC